MTLIPEPREVRTLRRPDGYSIGGRVLERDITLNAERRFQEFVPAINISVTAAADAMTATAQVLHALGVALELRFGSRRARRVLRKKARLVAHYQDKLDRIPEWKRDRG